MFLKLCDIKRSSEFEHSKTSLFTIFIFPTLGIKFVMPYLFQPAHAQDDQHRPEQDSEEWGDSESTSYTNVSTAHFKFMKFYFSLSTMMMFPLQVRVSEPWLYGSPEQLVTLLRTCSLTEMYVIKTGLYCHYSKTINRRVLKKNPLKNLRIMLKLNPYAKTARRLAILKHDPAVRT